MAGGLSVGALVLDTLWPNGFLLNLCQQQVELHENNNAANNPSSQKNVSIILVVGTWTPPNNPKGMICKYV